MEFQVVMAPKTGKFGILGQASRSLPVEGRGAASPLPENAIKHLGIATSRKRFQLKQPERDMIVNEELKNRILAVRLVIFDVDGVLTDGGITIHDDGSESKTFDVKDGHGMKLLQRAGLQIALISGRSCAAVEHRAKGLGIEHVYQGIHRKLDAYEKIKASTGLEDCRIAYVGDDLIDVPVMRRVGLAVCVQDAVEHVKPFAHYVTQRPGGRGAAREICEMILQVQGLWETVTSRYFQEDQS